MKKVSLIVYQKYLDDVVKALHESGIVEIVDISKEEPLLLEETLKAEIDPEAGTCTNYELRLTRLIDILRKAIKSPKGLKAMFHPQTPEKKVVEEHSLDELYSYAEGILNEIEKNILFYEEKIKKLDEEKERIDSDIEHISYFKDFKLDVSDIKESEYLIIKAGKTSELPAIEKEIKSLDRVILYSKQFGSGKKREWAIVIVAHISEKESVEKLCRERITLFDLQHLSGSPKTIITDFKKKIEEIKNEKKQIFSKLSFYAKDLLYDLLALREEIQLERVKKEVSKNFTKTDSAYIIKGWILEKDEEKLKNLVTSVSKDHIIIDTQVPSVNPDNPPIYLETPKWASSFETFLELFATPKYDEINPTIFMGIFFILFFAVMLGDAGYGFVIFILSLSVA